MCVVDKGIIVKELISKLLQIPFPYCDILMQQINESEISFIESQSYACVTFIMAYTAPTFPVWLDNVPLSWQIVVDDIPTLCQVYTQNGYIEKLEVIDMGFEPIKWTRLFNEAIQFNQEFEEQRIIELLTTRETCIDKMLVGKRSVDWMIKDNGRSAIVCFRDCEIHNLDTTAFTVKSVSIIKENQNGDHKYTVYSNDGKIDFVCSFMYIRWDAEIG